MTILAALLAGVFGTLALLHLYWGCGGNWAARAALPTTAEGSPLFRPGPIACFVVAGGLAAFGAVCLAHASVLQPPTWFPSTRWALLGIAAIFALRTLGDFRYVGLTRSVRGTEFARLDRLIYTPLCAALSVSLTALALN